MFSCFHDFQNSIQARKIQLLDDKIARMVISCSFFELHDIPKEEENIIIFKNIKKTKVVMINYIKERNKEYFLIFYAKTVLLIEESNLHLFNTLFLFNPNIKFGFIGREKTKNKFDLNIKIDYEEIRYGRFFLDNELERGSIIKGRINQPNSSFYKVFSVLFFKYFILQIYDSPNKNRIKSFLENQRYLNCKYINEEEYIKLELYIHSDFEISLAYDFIKCEIVLLKTYREVDHLFESELNNYKNLHFPFIPKFICKNKKGITIEYIKGESLNHIERLHLSETDKITIIFELLLTFEYLHRNNFIYRVLSPNKIIIDENKTAVLVDFSEMIENDIDREYTADVGSLYYSAPETLYNNLYSFKSDIYSLGLIIHYIMTGIHIKEFGYFYKGNNSEIFKQSFIKENIEMAMIFINCINKSPDERPSIISLINQFYSVYHSKINLDFNDLIKIYDTKLNRIYKTNIIKELYENKMISENSEEANKNDLESQYILGLIYLEGKKIEQDINKAIHYLTLAANQNYLKAQYKLGLIYFEGKFIPKDINNALRYFL